MILSFFNGTFKLLVKYVPLYLITSPIRFGLLVCHLLGYANIDLMNSLNAI